jgi:endonuclease III
MPLTVPKLLDTLEAFHSPQICTWPEDPYEFIVWWHCGYPASDATCARGWERLTAPIGIAPEQLLPAPMPRLMEALRPGGMVPELRAMRLKEIALRMQNELGGDLRAALDGPVATARKTLKKFPNIVDAGADRILLFAGIAAIAAVPSNCPQVLVRILHGQERESYTVNYREAQEAIAAQVPESFAARRRAYLLLKQHGQELCKRTRPKCELCPVTGECAFFAGHHRGVPTPIPPSRTSARRR